MNARPAIVPMFVPVRESKERFGFSRATAYRWAENGAFRIYKRGNIAFLKVEEVVEYLEASHQLGGKAGGKDAPASTKLQ